VGVPGMQRIEARRVPLVALRSSDNFMTAS
jgi:hypothetical protein